MRSAEEGRGSRSGFVAAAVTIAALCVATPASAADCGGMIGDPAPGYWGSAQGIFCSYDGGEPVSWTPPAGITEAVFSARGADVSSGRGGRVRGRLTVSPGQTYLLEPGGDGGASAISLDGKPLMVAGGGDGEAANYVTSSAVGVETEAAGAPVAPAADGTTYLNDGEAGVSWSTISKAPNWCVVPQLKGLRPVAARKRLAAANCAVGEVERRPVRGRRWQGRVRRQSPAPGTEIPPNGGVDLQIGSRPPGVVVNSSLGQPR